MKPVRGQGISFEERSANRLRLDEVKGNRRFTLAPFTFTSITVLLGKGTTSRDGGGAGTATLICDEETYSNTAGLPSKVTLTPAREVVALSVAATPVSGPRPTPNSE